MLKPFHFWCQKVLPLVFDDSLSYYEVLCKLTKKINEMIEYFDTKINAVYEWVGNVIKELSDGIVGYERYFMGKSILIIADGSVYNSTLYNALHEKYGASSVTVKNLGVAGYASSNAGATNNIVSLIDDGNDYDYILLMIGQFDYISQEEVGTYNDYGDSATRSVAAGLSKVLAYCNQYKEKSEVFVFTPLANRTGVASIGQYSGGTQWHAIAEGVYNIMLLRVAEHYGANIIFGENAPMFKPFQSVLMNRWTTGGSEPYVCYPNEAYITQHLIPFIAEGMFNKNTEAMSVDDGVILDHPLDDVNGSKIVRFFINKHTTQIRVNYTGLVIDGTTAWYTVCNPAWNIEKPITSFYGMACVYTSTSDIHFVPFRSVGAGFQVYMRGLDAGTYTVQFNGVYQNLIGSQGA